MLTKKQAQAGIMLSNLPKGAVEVDQWLCYISIIRFPGAYWIHLAVVGVGVAAMQQPGIIAPHSDR